jgi:hypothetical protein
MWLLVRLLSLAVVLVVGSTPLFAQEPPPDSAELILRPNDTITWTVSGPHRLRFGGSVSHGGAPLALTTFADVQNILDLNPTLTADGSGVALGPTAPAGGEVKVTGKVKASAAAGAEFFFTCGFPPHNGLMVTRSFKIAAADGQPARQIEIVAAPHVPPPPGGGPRWLLKTAAGDKNLTRP